MATMMDAGFLFVDESRPGDAASSDRNLRNARSFLMKRIRAKQASAKGPKAMDSPPKDVSPPLSSTKVVASIQKTKRRSRHAVPVKSDPSAVLTRIKHESSPPKEIRRDSKASLSTIAPDDDMVVFCTQCLSLDSGAKSGKCSCRKDVRHMVDHKRSSLDGILDPFNSAAVVTLDKKVAGLVNYFCTAIAHYITPLCYGDVTQREWLVPSFSHKAFMHSLLSVIAVQQCIMDPARPTEDILYHRLQAINAVQSNLADKTQALSDENIAAVLNLLCVEENVLVAAMVSPSGHKIKPDPAQRRVHMDGLRQMIQLRGGIQSLNKLRCLQSLLIRHTGAQAVTSFDESFLLPPNLLQEMYNYPAISHFAHVETSLASMCRDLYFDSEVIEIVRIAELMAKDKDKWKITPQAYPTLDCFDFHNMYTIGMNNAVRWLISNKPRTHIEDMIVSCTVVMFGLVCRQRPTVTGTILVVLERQRKNFSTLGVFDSIRGTGLDLWLSLLTQLGAEGSAYESFFAEEFARTLESYAHIQSLDALLKYMRRFLWCDCPLDDYTTQLWESFKRSLVTPTVIAMTAPSGRSLSSGAVMPLAAPVGTIDLVRQRDLRTTLAFRIREPLADIEKQPSAFLNPYTNGHPSLHMPAGGRTSQAYYPVRPPNTLYNALQQLSISTPPSNCSQSFRRTTSCGINADFLAGPIAYTE